ncbi:MAG: hypothetical protein GEU73_09040 [Chloroflexi bacterium]|nr:hypothetical protein [Chloroflexota bacterium]
MAANQNGERHENDRVDERTRGEGARRRERIVIEFPRIDPNIRELFLGMVPGRALLRLLTEPPEELVTHVRNVRRERLLAVRSVIDALIADTERPVRRPRAREVDIE